MIPINYFIRMIEEHDEPFLWEMLYQSLYLKEDQAPYSREILQEQDIAKYVEGWGRAGDVGFIAVHDAGQSVGTVTVRYFDQSSRGYGYVGDDVPELGMALVPECRGQGVGTALLTRMFEELAAEQVHKVSLSVDPGNLPAVKLYRRFGFREVGEEGTSITMVAEI